MSSHREAPEISKDPVADNTDVYAFVSPDRPSTVTLISNFVPLQDPPGGPNFFEFGDDVLYSIYIDNDGDGKPEISYVFRFETRLRNPNTFLYNTGQITSLSSPNWNKRQFYSVTRVEGPKRLPPAAAERRQAQDPRARQGPGVPAVQYRSALDAELRHESRRSSCSQPTGWHQGLRRPAPRGVLRRPRRDLRPRATCAPSRTCT